MDFGAFVRLENDIEGLIHISELSKKRIQSPGEAVKEGDEVTAEILTIDRDSKKIQLSIRLVESESALSDGEAASSGLNIFARVLKNSLKKTEKKEKSSDANPSDESASKDGKQKDENEDGG